MEDNISNLRQGSSLQGGKYVIKIYDIFEENGTVYYVMEYIEGGSLETYVNKRQRLDEKSALKSVGQIADALTYFHSKNILHLDVNPSNVLLRKKGDAVLIDFGISKCYDEQGDQTSTTPVGISKGYAPIEQYTQGGVSHFDPSTDVYSLGAVLYKLLSGEKPAEVSVLISEGLTIPLYISAQCSAVIRKAMSVRKSDRYLSAAGMKSALCGGGCTEDVTISVKDDKGKINGHEYVDLGLSVKWATCNVGASSPTDYGNYYAWGETREKISYRGNNSVTYEKGLGDIAGDSRYDAATANWGEPWRLPTKDEIDELLDECTWEWTTQGGHKGYRVMSKKNSNSIYLPAAGRRYGLSLYYAGEIGVYWSSTPYESNAHHAYYIFFNISEHYRSCNLCSVGHPVRPVSK